MTIAAAEGAVDPFQVILTGTGVVGAMFILALLGWIWLKPAVEKVFASYEAAITKRDADLARQQALIDTLLAVHQHDVLPVLADYEKHLSPMLQKVEAMLQYLEWLIVQQSDGGNRAPSPPPGPGGLPRPGFGVSYRGGVGQSPASGNQPTPPGEPR